MGGKQSATNIANHHLQKASQKQNAATASNGQNAVSQSEQSINIVDDNTFIQKHQHQSRRKQAQLKPHLKKTAYERLEASIPLQVMDIREFEGRLKKLIYGKETISLRQLTYVFARDFEDFEDLTNNDSQITQIMTSSVFKQQDSDEELSIQYLMLFGLLYCQGTHEEKSKCFYDVLQDGLQEQISSSDKDLKDCFWRLIELASVQVHSWSQVYVSDQEVKQSGVEVVFQKDSQDQIDKWAQVHENILEQFLDQVFDVHTRIKREEFIQAVAKKANYLFKPQEIRKKVKEEFSKL